MATIGELIINLNASTAAFVSELNKVKNLSFDTATQIQRSFTLIGTAALGMLGTFTGALAGMVDHTTELETHILHLATASGMSVESMSGLAFVAKMFGLEVDQIASAMEKFDKQLVAAQLGNAKASQNVSLLGIDPAAITTSDQALIQLSAHFSAMPDGIEKTAEAMLAFGKNGAAVLELLNQGPVAIQKYLDMARALGLVFDKEDAEAALHFKQNLEILQGSFEGFQIQLEKALLPNLNALTDVWASQAQQVTGAATLIDILKFSLQTVATVFILLMETAQEFGSDVEEMGAEFILRADQMGDAWTAFKDLMVGDTAGAKAAMADLDAKSAAIVQARADAAKRDLAIQTSATQQIIAITGEGTKATAAEQAALDKLTAARGAHQKAVESLQKSVESIITTYQTEIATMGMTNLQVTEYKLRADAAKLGISGWVEQEIRLIDVLNQRKTWLERLAVLDNSKIDAEKKNFLADKLALDLQDLEVAKKKADLAMQPDFSGVSPMSSIGAVQQTEAFTQAYQQQMSELGHSIAIWGMTTDQITRYNMSLLDSSTSAAALANNVVALQDKLAHMQNVTAAWKEFENIANRTLDELIFSGKSLGDVLKDLVKQLGEMALKWALFGGPADKGNGGIFGAIFGGLKGIFGLASGGPVSAGQTVMVGEEGPELFTPSTSGYVTPNGASAGGASVNVVYQIDARGSSITEEQFRRSLAASEGRAVQRALNMTRETQLRTA
jgi:hypothetical protein